MTTVGVMQMDGKLPNLALMQIASYHSELGDSVQWWDGPMFPLDIVYASKIFSFTYDELPDYVIKGGTGYDWQNTLPEEMKNVNPGDAWFLYPNYPNHIGFTERGCRLKCAFCVVPQKEGKPRKVADISDLLTNPNGEDRLVLLDDDFLGHPDCLAVMDELIFRQIKVCFSQGLNIRIITEAQAERLARIRFYNTNFTGRQVTFAWDNPKDKKSVLKGIQRCVDAGIKPYQMQFFILIGYQSTIEEDMERVILLKELGADPFVMPYDKSDRYQKRFTRWVNHRAIFKTVEWKDYR